MNYLDPSDLKLTELAVNGLLNAAGHEIFEKLTKRIDNMIDSPGRSLQYSEAFMYGYGSDGQRLYICGVICLPKLQPIE